MFENVLKSILLPNVLTKFCVVPPSSSVDTQRIGGISSVHGRGDDEWGDSWDAGG